MTVCVVVPCFDEAERLDSAAFAELAGRVDRLLFVDDGSRDDTTDVIGRLVDAQPERIDLVSLPRNVGKAEAVRVGLLTAIEGGASIDSSGTWWISWTSSINRPTFSPRKGTMITLRSSIGRDRPSMPSLTSRSTTVTMSPRRLMTPRT